MLFCSRPPSPGSRQGNSRAEMIRSVSLGIWEWQLESCAPAQAHRAAWGGWGLQALFIPAFSGKVGSLALLSPQAPLQVNSEGVWSWIECRSFWGVTDVQMSPDIPFLCFFLLLIQSVPLGMAEPWYPWGGGLGRGVVSGISFIQCTSS